MLVTTTLSVYYLPRLAELKTGKDIRREILEGYKVILPMAVACASLIYLTRDYVIQILFSDEFRYIEVLFFWQLIGDTLKIASWLMAFVMLAKAMVKLYIITELVFSALFYGLIFKLTPLLGLEATAISHAIVYLFYLLVMYWTVLKRVALR